jgi:hypothetical protein
MEKTNLTVKYVVQAVTQGLEPHILQTKQLPLRIPFPSASAPPSTPVVQPKTETVEAALPISPEGVQGHRKRFAKTLRLTSDQLVY